MALSRAFLVVSLPPLTQTTQYVPAPFTALPARTKPARRLPAELSVTGAHAPGLMAAGHHLVQAGKSAMELPLIREACNLAPSPEGQQTLYDAALEALDLDLMALACNRLEALICVQPI